MITLTLSKPNNVLILKLNINRYSMKKQLLLFVFVFISSLVHSQNSLNLKLKSELDKILKSDQILREYLDYDTSKERKTVIMKELGYENEALFKDNVIPLMIKNDSINVMKVEKIIASYGYPGKSLVGEPTNEAAWYVIQHSKKIAQYLPLIEKAAEKGEIPFTRFAMMQDRYLTQQGKEQIYGTQVQGKQITNKNTGFKEFFYYVSPIKNPEKVNELRKQAGFTTTVEENAERMEVKYRVYTLDEIAKMN